MGSTVIIGKGVINEIAARAKESSVEICGLLLGTADRIDAAVPCANVSPEPARSFEIDPRALIAALRAARNGGPEVVGCYHSHPSGRPEPSARDAREAEPNGWVWLIVGDGGVAAFRTVAGGPWLDAFEGLLLGYN